MAKTARRNPATTVDGYLDALPSAARHTLEKVRNAIRSAAPKADELISYQVPCYKQNGMLVGFAAINEHCSFFVMSPDLVKRYASVLDGYDYSGATVRFAVGKPLPSTLIKKLVKARIDENEAKALAKKSRKAVSSRGD